MRDKSIREFILKIHDANNVEIVGVDNPILSPPWPNEIHAVEAAPVLARIKELEKENYALKTANASKQLFIDQLTKEHCREISYSNKLQATNSELEAENMQLKAHISLNDNKLLEEIRTAQLIKITQLEAANRELKETVAQLTEDLQNAIYESHNKSELAE